MPKPPLPTRSRDFARALRVCSTDAERALWQHLRAGRLNGHKFRRQHPIHPYVVDFYCETLKLVIELDGSQHTPDSDAVRTQFLESRGLSVIRFWSHDVLQQTDAVLQAIWSFADRRTLTPTPLPPGEGL
ncbi:endonuclease domain-containing protein [Cognatiluteimonas telluris]|jgi:very-short-patch-repair endonuclease|uniref:endonuclease domain-containing protein n=1 Tax=Cognatiluteimonas telluris TaxID=1104775 RepID=UPI00140B520D|nr:endonuclease domain-containing protein [Lysobacter telluris]